MTYRLEDTKRKIVELRDNEHKTFADIALALNYERGYHKYSRQAVHAMYKRCKEKERTVAELGMETFDILNYFLRTGSVLGAHKAAVAAGINITAYAVQQLINKHSDIIEALENEIYDMVYDRIETGDQADSVRESLEYKGVKCTDKVYENCIENAYMRKLKYEMGKLIFESNQYMDSKSQNCIGKRLLEKTSIQESPTILVNNYKRSSGLDFGGVKIP